MVGLKFTKAGQKFIVTIERVRLQDDGDSVEFSTRIGPDNVAKVEGGLAAADAALVAADQAALYALMTSPTFYITDPKDDAVEFKINGAPFARFSAGQEMETIEFSFTAASTSIKDGQVRFTLPSGWTRAVVPDSAADSGS